MKIIAVIPEYLNYLKSLGRSERTVKGARYDLGPFMRFLCETGTIDIENLTYDVMAEYQQELAFKQSIRGTLLSLRTQGQLLGVARGFTRYLKQKEYLLHDPGRNIRLPRKPKTLPKVILTREEIKRMINALDPGTKTGFRNRVILEVMYDTAVRRSEVIRIRVSDLDLSAGFIHVRGKGNKERVVPLSTRVCGLVKSYALNVRPSYIQGEDPGYLILNRWGDKMSGNSLWSIVKKSSRAAGLKKNISPHCLRHTCATHMLKNGAPVRHLQELLGHESLESTQIYTRVTITELKKIHAKYHPGDDLDNLK